MGAIGGLVSGIFGLIGAAKQAEAAKERGAAQAYALHYQAKVARYNAMFTNQLGENQAETLSWKTAANVGAIKAAQAANSVDVNSGSNVRVVGSAGKLGKADELTIRANAARAAYGYQLNANLEDVEAEEAKKAAGIDASAAMLQGIGSLVGGAISAFTSFGGATGSYGGSTGSTYFSGNVPSSDGGGGSQYVPAVGGQGGNSQFLI